ncbi:hypothetical protein D918_04095 [Trichuris suis]|nr:hypothetical protein D918_04095 [Trichuris suis]
MDTEEELIVFGVTIEPHFSLADEIGRMEAKILLVDKSFALCSPPESSMHYVFAKEEFLGNYADLRPGCMVTISVSETEPHRAVRVAMKTEAMQCISNGTEQSESRDNSQPNKQLSGKSSDTTKIVTEKNDLKSFAQSSEIKPIARAPLTGYAEALYKKPTGEAQDNNNNINGSSANMNSTGTRIPPVLRKTVGY